nr:DUF2971 domain-containing protein [Vibrio lentus]
MWSHYADEHKGIVVEFHAHNPFFTESYRSLLFPSIGKASRVLYRKERLTKLSSEDIMEILWRYSFINPTNGIMKKK